MNKSDKTVAVLTIASANYLPYVKTLMESVRDSNPNYARYFFLVDDCKSHGIQSHDLFEVVTADALGIDSFEDMTVRYDVMELNTAVKPFAIEWLLENTKCSSVIYLDPDIFVYRRLSELEKLLSDGASIVLTPHLTEPAEDGRKPNDEHMLMAGVFNLGFIAVSRQAEAREFVRWWGRRLKTACHADFASNQFTDQRWVDLAPCFLADLKILRSAAYNVAYWNLAQRKVTSKGDALYFGGKKLAFFHFSGIDLKNPRIVSKHQDRLKWSDIQPLHSLFNEYRGRLKHNGWGAKRSQPYTYDWAGDLKLVPKVRQLFRQLYPEPIRNAQVDREFLLSMCNQPAGLKIDPEGRITRLMDMIYRERPDLQAAYPLTSQAGAEAFAVWFAESAERDYGLDRRLACPTSADRESAAASRLPPIARPRHPNHGKPWLYRQWRRARKWLVERI